MEKWKRNLFVLYAGQFLAMASMSCVTPFLPLYLQEMGMTDHDDVMLWSGLIYGANLLTAFLFAPIWGKVADRYGRKLMLIRSGLGMAVTISLMGVAVSPIHLLLLRLLNGVLSGFSPAAVALTATNTPKEKSGYALGVLQSGTVAGTICGPLIGGLLADQFGFRAVFFATGGCILIATLIVIFWVEERFEKREELAEKTAFSQDFATIVARKPMASLIVTAAVVRTAMVGTLPLIPLYVQLLVNSQENIVLYAGMASAVMGIANMISAPQLGKLGDRFGSHRVFTGALCGAILFFIPQAFVQHLWQLIALRFCTGACLGGMMPSVNALIRKYAPQGMESRTYSYVNCASFLGGLLGSLGMGAIASRFGLPLIFILSGVLLLLTLVWVKVMVYPQIHRGREADEDGSTERQEIAK